MKTLFRFWITLLLSVTVARAANPPPVPPADPLPVLIRVDLQVVDVPLGKALELLPNLRDPGSIDGACLQIDQMIGRKEATLIAWPDLIAKPGQRAVTEAIEEFRYTTTDDRPLVEPASAPKEAPKPDASDAKRTDGVSAPTLTFETRNIGVTLELEPNVSPDGTMIDLNLVPQMVRLLAMKSVVVGKDARGNEMRADQPLFATYKTTTSLSARSGQRTLLATFQVSEPEPRLEFFIIRATILKWPAPAK
jgi:hypothetical protein